MTADTITKTINYYYTDPTTSKQGTVADPYTANVEILKDTDRVTGTSTYYLGGNSVTGDYGTAITFSSTNGTSVDAIIKHYTDKGYVLSTNSYTTDATYKEGTNAFEVHLTHGTKAANAWATVTETIHYVYSDGTKAANDHIAAAKLFTRTGTTDLVTGETTWDAWSGSQTFAAVDSPTITGYTPDVATVAAATVTATSDNIETTVTYTPNTETATINFIDDTDSKTLETATNTGDYGSTITFSSANGTSVDAIIKHYTDKGYVLSTNSYTSAATYKEGTNAFEVHFTHGTQAANDSTTVNETIHYVYSDGSQAAADYVATPKSFTRTGTTDRVTGETTWNSWSAAQTFAAVTSPTITGYTASAATIAAQTVTATSADIEKTVTYTANPQTATVSFIDDDATDPDDNVISSFTEAGHYGETITFTDANNKTVADLIAAYTQGTGAKYVLVSNDYDGTETYQANDDDNVFEVHLTHKHVTDTKTVTKTINYQYADGTKVADSYTTSVTITQDNDLAAGTVTYSATGQTLTDGTTTLGYQALPSAKAGYSATTIPEGSTSNSTVDFTSKSLNLTVVYTADAAAATITFIDDTAKTTLEQDANTGEGQVDETIEFSSTNGDSVDAIINHYRAKGYVLVSSSSTNGATYSADPSENKFEVHLAHGTTAVSDSATVNQVIHYLYQGGTKDGQTAADDYTNAVTFTRTGTKDLVTSETTWNAWDQASQTLAAVTSPTITGYTASQSTVDPFSVTATSGTQETTVYYTADAATATLNVIDDTTKQTVESLTANGSVDETIAFSSTTSGDGVTAIISYYEG